MLRSATDKLLQAVLAEAWVVRTGQPVLIAGDLNADPAVIPCLAQAISADKFVDLVLAYSLGEGRLPAATCKFKLDNCSGARRDFILGCSDALATSTACRVTDRWFPPHFHCFLPLVLMGGQPRSLAPLFPSLCGSACWIDTPDRSSSSVARSVQDAWDFCRDELGLVSPDVVLDLGDAVSWSCVDDFWSTWSKNAEAGLFGAYCRPGGPVAAGSSAFVGRGLLRIRSWRLGDRAVGGNRAFAKGMRLMYIAPSTL